MRVLQEADRAFRRPLKGRRSFLPLSLPFIIYFPTIRFLKSESVIPDEPVMISLNMFLHHTQTNRLLEFFLPLSFVIS